jgi:hypothetical protein
MHSLIGRGPSGVTSRILRIVLNAFLVDLQLFLPDFCCALRIANFFVEEDHPVVVEDDIAALIEETVRVLLIILKKCYCAAP